MLLLVLVSLMLVLPGLLSPVRVLLFPADLGPFAFLPAADSRIADFCLDFCHADSCLAVLGPKSHFRGFYGLHRLGVKAVLAAVLKKRGKATEIFE